MDKKIEGGERQGLDVIDTSEFPFWIVDDRAKNKPLRLEFAYKDKRWEVDAHPKFGLPTEKDVEVFVGLLEVTKQLGVPEVVPFCRRSLLSALRWDDGSRCYRRLELSLDRLRRTGITAINAFFDHELKQWSSRHSFSLLAEYKLVDSRQAIGESWVMWSHSILAHLRARRAKGIDMALFTSLDRPGSKMLYRFLDMRRGDPRRPDYKKEYAQGARDLVLQRIGLRGSFRYASEIKRALNPLHDELMNAGYLDGATWGTRKDGELLVNYFFTPSSVAPREAAPGSAPKPLAPPAANPGRLQPGNRQAPRNGLQRVVEASSLPPGVAARKQAANGKPEDEGLELVQRFQRRKEERE